MKRVVKTTDAPEAIGPYSQAIVAGNFVFTAGQIALAPGTNTMLNGDIAAQTDQVLKNIKAIITKAGADMSSVVKTTVYLTRTEDFTSMNKVYSSYFNSDPPARVTIFVNSLPKGALVEIDAVAQL